MKEHGMKNLYRDRAAGRFSKIDSLDGREHGGGNQGGVGRGIGDFSNAWKQKARAEIRDREKFSIGTIDGGARGKAFRRAGFGLVYVGNF